MKRTAFRELLLFFAIMYAASWGIAALFIFVPAIMTAPFGPFDQHNPFFYLAVYCPSFTGVVLTALLAGRAGLKRYFQGVSPRVSIKWYAVALLGLPVVFLAGQGALSLIGINSLSFDPMNWLVKYPEALFLAWPTRILFDPGPLGEEFGWRGYALPRLLALVKPLAAAIILGTIWGIWHFPAYLLDSGRGINDFPFFVVFLVSATIMMTWIYKSTGGNFLVGGILVHLSINACGNSSVFPNWPLTAAIGVLMAIVLVVIVGPGLGHSPNADRKAASRDLSLSRSGN